MRTHVRLLSLLGSAALAVAGCTLQNQEMPALAGPSGYGLSVELAASPDFVPRDGASSSVITVTVRDHLGKAVSGQRLLISAEGTPTSGGQITASEVTTNGSGLATFALIAPALDQNVTQVTIGATPVGTNASESLTRLVRVNVIGPALPVPSLTFSPTAPSQFALVSFDASATTVGGAVCGSACTYAWTFGTEATATGMLAQHRFRQIGRHPVTLSVTTPDGTSASVTRTIDVTAAARPTAAFVISPTNPIVGETVYVNGATSSVASGSTATIARYIWNFGNGESTDSGEATASATFGAARTYTITLIVEDSNGVRSAAVTQTVTVAEPPED